MKCVYHGDRDAEYVCSTCGKPICRECAVTINGKNVCRPCSYAVQQSHQGANRQYDGYSSFLFFIFLAVPGLRHMYIGLMKRGTQFLVSFFGTIMAMILLGHFGGILVPVLFIAWFYSAFDSYQCRKLMAGGQKVEDKPIFEDYGYNTLSRYLKEKRTTIGIVVAVFGAYLLIREIGNMRYGIVPGLLREWINILADMFIPLLLIFGGILLLRRSKGGEITKDE